MLLTNDQIRETITSALLMIIISSSLLHFSFAQRFYAIGCISVLKEKAELEAEKERLEDIEVVEKRVTEMASLLQVHLYYSFVDAEYFCLPTSSVSDGHNGTGLLGLLFTSHTF